MLCRNAEGIVLLNNIEDFGGGMLVAPLSRKKMLSNYLCRRLSW